MECVAHLCYRYIRVLVASSIGLTLSFFTLIASAQWTEVLSGIGDAAGLTISDIAVNGNGKIFAGTTEGIYRSANNGASWQALNEGLFDGPLNSFAVSGGNILAAFNGQTGVVRSADEGMTWTQVLNGLPDFAVVKLATLGANIFGLINNGDLYMTSNAGASWTKVATSPASINALTANGNVLFAATGNGVYKSVDGIVWTASNSGLTSLGIYKISSSGSNVLLWNGDGIYLSTNGGSTWTPAPLPIGYSRIASIGSTLVFSNDGVVKISFNNGSTWSDLPNLSPFTALLAVGSTFFAGTYNGVYVSPDGGISWTLANTGFVFARPAISADAHDIIATNGWRPNGSPNIFISNNDGDSWASRSMSTAVRSVLVRGSAYSIGTIGYQYSSTDKGLTWAKTGEQHAALGTGESAVYGGDDSYIYRSIDQGRTWTRLGSTVRNASGFAEKGGRLYASTIFTTGIFGGVFYSTSQGISWQKTNANLPPINSIAYDGSLIICGTTKGIYKSSDGGASWVLAGLAGVNINSVLSIGGKILAAHRGIEVSSDGGISWAPFAPEILAQLGSYYEVISMARSGTKVFAISNNGRVWRSSCLGPDAPIITASSVNPPTLTSSFGTNNQWYLDGNPLVPNGTNRTISITQPGIYTVKATQDGCLSPPSMPFLATVATITGIDDVSHNIFDGMKLFPNPAHQSISIELSGVVKNRSIEIKVFTILGELVYKENSEAAQAATVDVSSLPGGVYIIEAESCGQAFHQRFVKQ
jgi:photosystem II stability/assembly factor-like uncharacterized protein